MAWLMILLHGKMVEIGNDIGYEMVEMGEHVGYGNAKVLTRMKGSEMG